MASSLRQRNQHKSRETQPIDLLHDQLLTFFSTTAGSASSPRLSSARFNAIKSTVSNNHWTATRHETEQTRRAHRPSGTPALYTVWREETCWTRCYSAASLVMVLAAPQILAAEALIFPGHDTRDDVVSSPSANIRVELRQAREKAQTTGETSVLCIGLLDDSDQARRYNVNYISYAHWFVVVVATEGIRIYQSWYEQYTLQDWLNRGHARLRSWEEVDHLLELLGVLENSQDDWTEQINEAYRACFDVDVSRLRRSVTPMKCAYHPYFTISRLDNVITRDIQKFRWECSDGAESINTPLSPRSAPCLVNGPYRR